MITEFLGTAGLVKCKHQKQITRGTIKVWLWRLSQFWTHQSLPTEWIRAQRTVDSTAANTSFAFAVAMVKGRTHTLDKQREGMDRVQLACDFSKSEDMRHTEWWKRDKRMQGQRALELVWKPGRLRQEVWAIQWVRSQPGKLKETLPQNGLRCGTLV